jgi:DNA-binding MarR family transcriptional regulator
MPDDDDGIAELRVALDRLARLLSSRSVYTRHLDSVGLELSQQAAMLLATLYRDDGPLTLTALAAHAHIDTAAASRQLRQLEDRGLVTRARDAADGRAVQLSLTTSGRRQARKLVEFRRDHLRRAVTPWPIKKRRQLAKLLDELVESLNAELLLAPPERSRRS